MIIITINITIIGRPRGAPRRRRGGRRGEQRVRLHAPGAGGLGQRRRRRRPRRVAALRARLRAALSHPGRHRERRALPGRPAPRRLAGRLDGGAGGEPTQGLCRRRPHRVLPRTPKAGAAGHRQRAGGRRGGHGRRGGAPARDRGAGAAPLRAYIYIYIYIYVYLFIYLFIYPIDKNS